MLKKIALLSLIFYSTPFIFATPVEVMSTLESIKSRNEIPIEDQWNLNSLYPSFDAWENAFQKIKESQEAPYWPTLQAFRGELKKGSETLKQVLDQSFYLSRELEKLYTYAHLRHDEDISFDLAKNCYQRISALLSDFQRETSWIEPELLSLSNELIHEFLQAPILSNFKFYLEKIVRLRLHTLSSDKEELIAMAAKPLLATPRAFTSLNNADIKFPLVLDSNGQQRPLSHGLFQLYLRSQDRVLRENAFKTLHNTYSSFENTIAELLQGEIQSHVFNAKARNYPTALDAALFPKNIPTSVYHTLIETVRSKLPILHRYVKLRKKILGLSELHLYDMYVPLVPEVDIKFDYKEAEEVVIESVAPLGETYQKILQRGLLSERWVDRYENKNKRSGAYSSGCYDSHPYILMNYRGILRDVFTLAHESGHSMQTYLSNCTQPYVYSHYPIFVAEVASTFNEELLSQLLRKKRQLKEEKIFLITEKIEDIRATLFRQTLFAEFELKIHSLVEKDIPLTPSLLKEIYLQLNKDYYGSDIVIDEDIAIEWARIPHFYYNYYVFQYATGISAALALVEKVVSPDYHARDQYLEFLKAGGSLYPIDLLKLAGIDMTTKAPVELAIQRFDSLLDELEGLLKN